MKEKQKPEEITFYVKVLLRLLQIMQWKYATNMSFLLYPFIHKHRRMCLSVYAMWHWMSSLWCEERWFGSEHHVKCWPPRCHMVPVVQGAGLCSSVDFNGNLDFWLSKDLKSIDSVNTFFRCPYFRLFLFWKCFTFTPYICTQVSVFLLLPQEKLALKDTNSVQINSLIILHSCCLKWCVWNGSYLISALVKSNIKGHCIFEGDYFRFPQLWGWCSVVI